MKKKIAVQLFGHLRTYERCAPALQENLLERYGADVFIHTWDTVDHSSPTWHGQNDLDGSRSVDSSITANITKLYSPKAMSIESQNLFTEPGSFGTHSEIKISLEGMKYMLYSQQKVNKLRQEYAAANGVSYDYVLVTRPDILLLSKIDFSLYEAEFEYNEGSSIHLINNPDWSLVGNKYIQYPRKSDLLFFSRPENIDIISSNFSRFEKVYKGINSVLPEGVECPEIAFIEGMVQGGVVPRFYHNDFVILRSDIKNVSLSDDDNAAKYLTIFLKVTTAISKAIDLLISSLPASFRSTIYKIFLKLGNYASYKRALESQRR